MKSVLIVDAHPLFRDFLKEKLAAGKIEVNTASEDRDAFTKMITTLPNLVIMDRGETQEQISDFMQKKLADPNTASIPIIMTGPLIDKALIGSLARYGVFKYFTKPIKFDLFFEAIGNILHLPVIMDTTPCVLDIHRNSNIIFIEVAQGLNREKLALLKFKLAEMIETEELESPKIIIMLTNLDLTFIDGLNLEFLIDNVLDNPKIHRKNVKILSLSQFVSDLVDGHSEYDGIEVTDNLPQVLNSLVESSITTSVSDLITEKILSGSSGDEISSSIETRFYSDTGAIEKDDSIGSVFTVALIDENPQSAASIQKLFSSVGARTDIYSTGQDFINSFVPDKYSLVILDVLERASNGFEILNQFKADRMAPPVIVYSASAQRDLIVKVLSSGAALYLMKPQKPEVLLNKAISLLNKNI
ncbi:MAG: response regulator [Treponema sp.]|nr:response regulator [Treponema sp.]